MCTCILRHKVLSSVISCPEFPEEKTVKEQSWRNKVIYEASEAKVAVSVRIISVDKKLQGSRI